MTNKPPFDGERIQISDLLEASFSGEWGSADGPVLTPVLRTANFNEDGTLDYSNPAMRCITEKKVRAKKMRRGDIILEKSGGTPHRPVGILAYYDSDGLALCSNFNQVLRFDSFKVVPRYAFYQLRWLKDKGAFAKYTRKTTGLQNLEMKRFSELVLSIPKLSIQHHVVGILDKILDDRNLLDDQLAKLDELVKSRFVEMFGDGSSFELCAMDDLLCGIVSGTNVSGNQRPLQEGEFAVLKISAVTKGWFKADEYKVVDDISSIKMIHPRKGDLLFSRANTSEMVGATAIVDDDYDQLFLPDKLWRLDPAPGVDTVFLKQLLSSPQLRAEMSKVSTGTSGSMQNISMAKFRKLKAFVPPLALQQEFAAFVQQVDKLRFVRTKW